MAGRTMVRQAIAARQPAISALHRARGIYALRVLNGSGTVLSARTRK